MRRKHDFSTFQFYQEKNGKVKVEIKATGFPAIILALKTKPQVLGTCYRQTAHKQAVIDHMEKLFQLIKFLAKIISLFDPSQDNYFWKRIWISNLVPYME